jgi:ADP-ribosyl-[dinitrogen reductase] hydrolase
VPTGEPLERLGGGWTGEEALAIAVACVLRASTFEDAVIAAVNHSGDSDSTGSIAGNLLGAVTGAGSIPARWLEHLEAMDVIEQMAYDCCAVLGASDTLDVSVMARHGWKEAR